MKRNEWKMSLSGSGTLKPSDSLRERILERCKAEMPESANDAESARILTLPRRKPRRAVLLRRLVIAATFALILTVAVSGVAVYASEYETVYLDVNPSVALSVNRFGRIIGVDYLNADAGECLSETSLKHLPIGDGMEKILTAMDSAGYLENAELYISVAGKNGDADTKLLNALTGKAEQCKAKQGYSIEIGGAKVTAEEKEAARESGVSPVKYQLIREITERDNGKNPADLNRMTMKELKELSRTAGTGNPETDGTDGEKKNDGNGNGNGKNNR